MDDNAQMTTACNLELYLLLVTTANQENASYLIGRDCQLSSHFGLESVDSRALVAQWSYKVNCYLLRSGLFGLRLAQWSYKVSCYLLRSGLFGLRLAQWSYKVSCYLLRSGLFGLRLAQWPYKVSCYLQRSELSGLEFR